MFSLIIKKFVKNYDDVKDNEVRTKYGVVSGGVGIFLNIVLFAVKYLAGILSGSVAIRADALNNLSDAGSSIITLIGFRMASAKPDEDHPFGHGRVEYLSALAVSMIIIFMGFEIGKTSIEKIISPDPSEITAITVGILVFSILIKFYMFSYNKRFGEKIDSAAMKATAIDSLSDVASTSVVLLSMIIMKLFSVDIDGWCGVLVAIFILKAGIETAKDTLTDLLGKPSSPELIKEIEDIVGSHKEIIGMHDLVIHDYGPGRMMISLHGEIPANGDILTLHDVIDNLEKELAAKLNCNVVIHLDPVDTENPQLQELKEEMEGILYEIEPDITMHDFRMVSGPTHTNIIFDILIPYNCKISDSDIKKTIYKAVHERHDNFFCVIHIDRPYV